MVPRFLFAALFACATASAQTLSPDGYGKIRFGDRLVTAEKRHGKENK